MRFPKFSRASLECKANLNPECCIVVQASTINHSKSKEGCKDWAWKRGVDVWKVLQFIKN